MMRKEVTRFITLFQRVGDDFVESIEINEFEFGLIRKILDIDESDSMYDSYPITGSVLHQIKELLGNKLPNGDYEYFLEAES